MKQLTDLDLKIAYCQAYNCAAAFLSQRINGGIITDEQLKKEIEYWHDYFYRQLTSGYIQKFAPQEVKSEIDTKKIADVARDEAENDL